MCWAITFCGVFKQSTSGLGTKSMCFYFYGVLVFRNKNKLTEEIENVSFMPIVAFVILSFYLFITYEFENTFYA